MDLKTSWTIFFTVLFAPLLFSLIFVLFRLSSRFGYSFTTLRVPLLSVAVAIVYTVLMFFASDLIHSAMFYCLCCVWLLAIFVSWYLDSRYLRKLAKQRKTIIKKLGPNRQILKIIARITLGLILTLVTLITITILWTIVTNPIFDKLDQDKFTTLDTQMQGIYHNLKTASSGVDDWKYRTGCYDTSQNWLSPPDIMCEAAISAQKTIASVDELNKLQAKYYPIISNNNGLKQASAGLKSAFGFGKSFSVSIAYAKFVEKKTNIDCTYEISLHQLDKNIDYQTNNDNPGSEISGDQAGLSISFRCDESARNFWYQPVQNSSMLIPR